MPHTSPCPCAHFSFTAPATAPSPPLPARILRFPARDPPPPTSTLNPELLPPVCSALTPLLSASALARILLARAAWFIQSTPQRPRSHDGRCPSHSSTDPSPCIISRLSLPLRILHHQRRQAPPPPTRHPAARAAVLCPSVAPSTLRTASHAIPKIH